MPGPGSVTSKITPLLATPLTVTIMFPVIAPTGTDAVMVVLLQLAGVAAIPLNVIVLLPCELPKLAPLMVMSVPTTPLAGDIPEMLGNAATVTVVVPQIDPSQALTVLVPNATPVALPRLLASLLTVATVGAEELHVIDSNVCVLLSLKVPVAVKVWSPPIAMEAVAGLTVIEDKFGGVRVPGWYNSVLASAL